MPPACFEKLAPLGEAGGQGFRLAAGGRPGCPAPPRVSIGGQAVPCPRCGAAGAVGRVLGVPFYARKRAGTPSTFFRAAARLVGLLPPSGGKSPHPPKAGGA